MTKPVFARIHISTSPDTHGHKLHLIKKHLEWYLRQDHIKVELCTEEEDTALTECYNSLNRCGDR